MSTRTVPANPDASDGAGGERRRRVAVIAGGVALVTIALGATACTAAPSSSSPLSLSGAAGPSTSSGPAAPVAVTSSSAAPGAPVAVASPALVSAAPTTPGSPTRGTPSRPATAPAHSGGSSTPPRSATSPASSAPSNPGPPSYTPPPSDQPSSAPSTEPASSPPDAGGGLSVSRDCPDQTTVSVLDPYTCTLTASGGTTPYDWLLFVNGEEDLGIGGGLLPTGLSVTGSGSPFATYIITGKPESRGTYAITVTVIDSEPVRPQVSASTSFTLTVQ
jgi:hypothetical protein